MKAPSKVSFIASVGRRLSNTGILYSPTAGGSYVERFRKNEKILVGCDEVITIFVPDGRLVDVMQFLMGLWTGILSYYSWYWIRLPTLWSIVNIDLIPFWEERGHLSESVGHDRVYVLDETWFTFAVSIAVTPYRLPNELLPLDKRHIREAIKLAFVDDWVCVSQLDINVNLQIYGERHCLRRKLLVMAEGLRRFMEAEEFGRSLSL